jgi:hypothetical protein
MRRDDAWLEPNAEPGRALQEHMVELRKIRRRRKSSRRREPWTGRSLFREPAPVYMG